MKNKNERPTLEKFRISKLAHPERFFGGDPADDDHTITGNKGKKCIMASSLHVDI